MDWIQPCHFRLYLRSKACSTTFLLIFPTAIASDKVDSEWVTKPCHGNTVLIRDYMVIFDLVSSIIDFPTFGLLLFLFHATSEEFRTG
jgi:Mg2+-importing ATPase